jgi:hypothetical protein
MSHYEPDPSRDYGAASRPLSQLRVRLQDDARRGLSAGFSERLRMEAESAMEWDRTSGGGQGYPEDSFETGQQFAEGNEHRIFQNDEGSRAIKLTRPPNFGARGSLLDYLDNLVLNNFLSGDDLRIEGVINTEAGPQLVVSQPWVKGNPAAVEEIRHFFSRQGFEPAGENAWYSPVSGVRIMDARPANIFVDAESGLLMPIDIHIHAPADVLEEAWAYQKKRELPL